MRIVDLRQVHSRSLESLFQEEIHRWRVELQWDYQPSIDLVRKFIDSHALGGYAAIEDYPKLKATYDRALSGFTVGGSWARTQADPQNVVDGQFSGPFVIAVALATGAMGWDSYGLLQDDTVRGLMGKVECVFDPEIEAEFPTNMSGKLTIEARGQRFEQKVVVPKGEPGNFLTENELRQKFAGKEGGPCEVGSGSVEAGD